MGMGKRKATRSGVGSGSANVHARWIGWDGIAGERHGQRQSGGTQDEGTRAPVGKCNNIECRCEMRVGVGENGKRKYGMRMRVRMDENMGCE